MPYRKFMYKHIFMYKLQIKFENAKCQKGTQQTKHKTTQKREEAKNVKM